MVEILDKLYPVLADFSLSMGRLFAAVCLVKLCQSFVQNKKAAIATGTAYFITLEILYYIPFVINGILAYFLALLSAFAALVTLDRRNVRIKVFLIFTFFVIRWIAFSLIYLVGNFLSNGLIRWVYLQLGENNPQMLLFDFLVFLVNSLAERVFAYLLLSRIVMIISKSFPDKERELSLKELIGLLIPTAGGVICYVIFHLYNNIYEKVTGAFIYDVHPMTELLISIYQGVTLAAIVSNIAYFQAALRKRDEENAAKLLENSVKDIRQHITQVQKLYGEIRGVRHDIKNHITVIGALLEEGKTKEAAEYLKPLSNTVDLLSFPARTGNPVTDAIISEKMREAEELGVDFSCKFHCPGKGFDVFDISVILSNALSNAIEAAEKGGWVKVTSLQRKKTCLITVKNSFNGRLVVDSRTGFPGTNKQDKERHGIGIINIKMTAEKYCGGVNIRQEENTVTLTVMLQSKDFTT